MGPLQQPGCCREKMVSARWGGVSRPVASLVLSWGLGVQCARGSCACGGPREVVSRDRKRTLTPALLGHSGDLSPWQGVFGELGKNPSPSTVLQASRKAGTRSKAAATKQAQRGSSNVFSMFEQAQIQEFKEVSPPTPPTAWDPS